MIDEIIADIATKVKGSLPFVQSTQYIARQDITGIIHTDDEEAYSGIDDQKDGHLYFRFRDGMDETIVSGSLTSARNMEVTARMRAVFLHRCGNELPIARFLAFGIMSCENHAMRYAVRVRAKSTDKVFIYQQETKQPKGPANNDIKLVMVDFDVTYKDGLIYKPECVPACHVC